MAAVSIRKFWMPVIMQMAVLYLGFVIPCTVTVLCTDISFTFAMCCFFMHYLFIVLSQYQSSKRDGTEYLEYFCGIDWPVRIWVRWSSLKVYLFLLFWHSPKAPMQNLDMFNPLPRKGRPQNAKTFNYIKIFN